MDDITRSQYAAMEHFEVTTKENAPVEVRFPLAIRYADSRRA